MTTRIKLTDEEKKRNQKKACMKWRDENREVYNEYCKTAMQKWTAANREHYNKTKRDYRRWRLISDEFRHILLDE